MARECSFAKQTEFHVKNILNIKALELCMVFQVPEILCVALKLFIYGVFSK